MAERDPITGAMRDYGATAAPPSVGFSDCSPTELFNLSEGVADNITTFNSTLRTLEKMMKQLGGHNDNLQLREKIRNIVTSGADLASQTSRSLQRLAIVVRRAERPRKLQAERLTQAFSESLGQFAKLQKEVTEKMSSYMPRMKGDIEQQAIDDDEEAALIQNQQAQVRVAQFEEGLALEREAAVAKVEADVLHVDHILRDLAALVQQQASHVDTVESHIEAAAAGVEAGADELAKAAEYQRRYRRKMFILIIIAVILATVFIVWIVKAFR